MKTDWVQLSGKANAPNRRLTLWYCQPARDWNEAIPLGNGSLGVMAFGRINSERLNLNLDTLYAGGPHPQDNPRGVETVLKINQLLLAGKEKEARDLLKNYAGRNTDICPYGVLGNLYLKFAEIKEVADYRRELDLDSAIFRMSYRVDNVHFRRELFVSAVDQVMVMRVSCNKPGRISFIAMLDSPNTQEPMIEGIDNNRLIMRGHNEDYKGVKGVLKFSAYLQIVNSGGELTANGDQLKVKNADEVKIILTADTSYRNYKDFSKDPDALCQKRVAVAAKKSYERLRKDHIKDYQQLFRRVDFDLGKTSFSKLPTNERLAIWRQNTEKGKIQEDQDLVALYFQMCRYVVISCSRPGTQPMTVLGLWNEQTRPQWGGVWANNINGPMLYWGVEEANLPECHEPWLKMITELVENGRKSAKITYGLDGWVVHLRTDLWRYTSVQGRPGPHTEFRAAGPWLCRHLWEHYLFSGDRKYLEKIYPVMRGAAQFFRGWMVEDPKTGRLLSGASQSPERWPLALGVTIDMMVAWELYSNCIDASRILDVDEDFRQKLIQTKERMVPLRIGQWGQLQEWYKDLDKENDPFRHIPHLYAFHPGSQITIRGTPKLAAAMKKSIEGRIFNKKTPSFNFVRKINSWARFEDGEKAYFFLEKLIATHTLNNLVSTHPPFHVEGNSGSMAGLIEMLLQSHAGEISLLPALPKTWPNGQIRGLRARGGFEVNIEWKSHCITKAVIHSKLGGICRVRTTVPVIVRGARAKPARGPNPNPFYNLNLWKKPEIVDPSKVEDIKSCKGFVVDFDTKPRGIYVLVATRKKNKGPIAKGGNDSLKNL